MQLGIIGSTDNHTATGGFVDEENWSGTAFGLGSFERAMARLDWNPGGLVAVWAEENTRASIFAALKRREVYATSGPRLKLRLNAASNPLSCENPNPADATPMGGELNTGQAAYLQINAQADVSPLAAIQIIKGQLTNGQLAEEVIDVWQSKQGAKDLCITWQDPAFNKDTPAFWYARVLQTPTPRWSAYRCQREGRCEEFSDAYTWTQERGWTSPIWHLPTTP